MAISFLNDEKIEELLEKIEMKMIKYHHKRV